MKFTKVFAIGILSVGTVLATINTITTTTTNLLNNSPFPICYPCPKK